MACNKKADLQRFAGAKLAIVKLARPAVMVTKVTGWLAKRLVARVPAPGPEEDDISG